MATHNDPVLVVMIAESLHVVENEPNHRYDCEDNECDEDEKERGAGNPQLRAVQTAVHH